MIKGHCDARFSRVRDVFTESFDDRLALGAAVAITIDGAPVVDLWGGFADGKRTRAWERDTLMNVFSVTKGFTAMCAHRLVDQGLLDLESPVERYWPEFTDKRAITVASLLSHRAGLPGIREPLPSEALYDWNRMTSAFAAERPWWEPNTKHGYHAVSFGWLVGEVIRRVANKTVAQYFREDVARGLDVHIGVDAADDARCAELRSGPRPQSPEPTIVERIMAAPDSMVALAFVNPFVAIPHATTTREWRAAELPAMNGHANARSIAELYGTLDRVLSSESIARASTEHARGVDAVLDVPTRFGLGFMLSQPEASFGPGARTFGHPGMGGSLGFYDPGARIGFGYVANRMGSATLLDPRATALVEALYAALT